MIMVHILLVVVNVLTINSDKDSNLLFKLTGIHLIETILKVIFHQNSNNHLVF